MRNLLFSRQADNYTLYGVVFGFLFPLGATLIEALRVHGALSLGAFLHVQANNPLLWIIDSAPFWLGLFARFAGVREDRLRARQEQLQGQVSRLEEVREQLNLRLGRILEGSSSEIFLVDAATLQIIQANQGACRNLQYSQEELAGRTVHELWPEMPPGQLQARVQPLHTDAQSLIRFRTRQQRKNGTRYPVQIQLQWIPEEQPPVFMVIADDITETSRMEEKLQFVEAGVEHAGEAAFWLDFESGRFLYVNAKACETLGYTRQELLGMNVFDIAPDLSPQEWENRKTVWKEKKTLTLESVQRKKNGELFPVEVATHWVRFKNQDFIIAFARDITQRKQTERALQLSEERLKLALEAAMDGLWDWNVQTGEAYFSPRWMTMLDYGPGELEPNYETWKRLLHPQDLPRVLEALEAHLEGLEPLYQAEFRMKSKSGRWKWIMTRGKVVERDAQGRPLRAVGTHTDITRQKETEEELKNALAELERVNQAKSNFLASMSHELRTPLNAILGFGQLMALNEQDLTPTQKENIEHILKAGNHLLELINDVLDLVKIDSGAVELVPETVCLRVLVDEMVRLVQPMVDQKRLTVVREGEWDQSEVWADRTRLKQVVLNLLSNAIKYNREGGGVVLHLQPLPENRVCFSVEDTGKGLDRDSLDQLFEPFSRITTAGENVEGTGMGLVITRRLVELMGGSIAVESTPGQGSCFSIELPRGPETPAPLAAAPAASLPNRSAPEYGKRRLLCVEDNAANLELIRRILDQRPQVELLTAANGAEALEKARTHLPDLILLDINLPDLDGLTVFKKLQDHPDTRPIPVVILTANAMPGEIQKARNLGVKSYLTKPLDIAGFLETVDRFLAGPVKSPAASRENPS